MAKRHRAIIDRVNYVSIHNYQTLQSLQYITAITKTGRSED